MWPDLPWELRRCVELFGFKFVFLWPKTNKAWEPKTIVRETTPLRKLLQKLRVASPTEIYRLRRAIISLVASRNKWRVSTNLANFIKIAFQIIEFVEVVLTLPPFSFWYSKRLRSIVKLLMKLWVFEVAFFFINYSNYLCLKGCRNQ